MLDGVQEGVQDWCVIWATGTACTQESLPFPSLSLIRKMVRHLSFWVTRVAFLLLALLLLYKLLLCLSSPCSKLANLPKAQPTEMEEERPAAVSWVGGGTTTTLRKRCSSCPSIPDFLVRVSATTNTCPASSTANPPPLLPPPPPGWPPPPAPAVLCAVDTSAALTAGSHRSLYLFRGEVR